jgi:hypothetical protein
VVKREADEFYGVLEIIPGINKPKIHNCDSVHPQIIGFTVSTSGYKYG